MNNTTIYVHKHTETLCLHARAAGPVDDDRLACLVYIVLHAKVGRHPMDQHTVVGRHMRELLKGTERARKDRMEGNKGRRERETRERDKTQAVRRK